MTIAKLVPTIDPTMNVVKTKFPRAKLSLIIIGVWSANIVLITSQTYYGALRDGRVPKLSSILTTSVSYSVLWMLLTPFVLALGRKFPLEQKNRARNLSAHIVLSLLFAIVHTVLSNAVAWYVRLPPGDAFPFDKLFTQLVGYFDYGLLVYWIILLIQQSLTYYRRVQERELNASQLETQLMHTRLQALKMQLHPHFLFNTLHSVSALLHEDTEAADKMLARLGDFLRISLDNSGTRMVSLRKEIESLHAYFEIERVRFRDSLELRLEIEPRTLDAQVPSFLWQPILENAIRHGIATSETSGRITVRAHLHHDMLVLEVEDNGTGLPEHQHEFQLKEGIGLANTRAILQHIYGSHHHFQVTQSANRGAIATLEIPFRKTEPAELEIVGGEEYGNKASESTGDRR